MNATAVLLVEDEPEVAGPLAGRLEREGFEVRRAATAAAALESFRRSVPDVVLLDLRLPDGNGRDVARAIRETSGIPIIMVTAAGEEADRVIGLELAADDYVVKPFSGRELVARIRAVLRRGSLPGLAGPTVVGDIRLDPGARVVTVRGSVVDLAPREFDLLAFLMTRAGQVVRREEIMERLWDPEWFGSTKTLDVHVASLRRKLEEDPAHPRYLHTVRKVGFRFVTPDDLNR